MRATFTDHLRCPRCRTSGQWRMAVQEEDVREVRSAALRCQSCDFETAVRDGVVDLLPEPPGWIRREAEGLRRFADEMVSDGWTKERLLALPYDKDGYWFGQATLMHQVLHESGFQPGDRVLDVGSNTCWASAMFAERRLEAVALDITDAEWQGLRTGEWWFEPKDCFFERVLGRMDDLPFADRTFDWIWACQVLHHNAPNRLQQTLEDLHRVLKPGGKLLVANEPLLHLTQPRNVVEPWVQQFEGEEHAYWRFQYVRAARMAGFDVEVRGPWYHRLFQEESITLSRRMSTLQLLRAALSMAARRQTLVTRPYLAYRSYVTGGTALHMVCRRRA